MLPYRQKLQALLRELFQFDSADLDFGIYAIMNRKRDEVAGFIEHDLLDAVQEGLQLQSDAHRAQALQDYEAAHQALIEAAGAEALDGEAVREGYKQPPLYGVPVIRHAVDAYEAARAAKEQVVLSADTEAQVYNDLYRFFARYYDDGDFIAQRRYGAADKYAIPYNGEEVALYWANFDQYYVKSGETFTDYRFQLEGGVGFEPATVFFRLQAASVAQNNVKGEKRFFVLAGDAPLAWDAGSRTLTVAFEYRPLTEEEKKRTGMQKQQDKLSAEAEKAILDAAPEPLVKARLGTPDGEKEQTVLARHLARYTARNTRDYFIHKDLAGFLTRELDFYLKSEVLRLEDLDWNRPGVVRIAAARLETVRHIAGKIIAFLAQIEDFQKRLFEKKKFITETQYCITVGHIAEDFYPDIAGCEAQWQEWKALFHIDEEERNLFNAHAQSKKGHRIAFLRVHPTLALDTRHFDAAFVDRLLASYDDLDGMTDGLLVHSENFQALNLLLQKYRQRVQCIHIDPPYNTQTSGFLYKNDYQHSSWLAMMENRIGASLPLLGSEGSYLCHIDENEYERLHLLFERFPIPIAGTVAWDKRNPMNAGRGVATQHEYIIWRSWRNAPLYLRNDNVVSMLRIASEIVAKYGGVTEEAQKEYAARVDNNPDLTGGEKAYRYLDEQGRAYQSVSLRAPEPRTDPKFHIPLIHPITRKPCPVPPNGFSRTPETLHSMIASGEIIFGKDETTQPRQKVVLREGSRRQVTSVIQDARKGKADVDRLGLDFPYCHPVSLYEELVAVATDASDDIVLDYFAGSGTTGHAVINLNREDGANRRFILVEMGDYFDTVLLPRIKKATFAPEWRDGKPKRIATAEESEHSPRIVKVIRLESYEDALNNVRFRELDAPLLAALHAMPDYMLHYMLDYETASSPSLLDLKQFERPFEYKLNTTRHDVTGPRPVDLVTTFNFLLGLRVRTLRRFEREGRPVVRVTGTSPDGRRVCVLWRDVPPLEEMEAEKDWLQAHVLHDVAYDLLYVNGESALPGALPIEPEFKRLMFEGVS